MSHSVVNTFYFKSAAYITTVPAVIFENYKMVSLQNTKIIQSTIGLTKNIYFLCKKKKQAMTGFGHFATHCC